MHAQFEKVVTGPERSFFVEEQRLPRFDAPWHFHPEMELTGILGSRGRRFVGDSIAPFREGELVLLGPDLPHFWHNEGAGLVGDVAHSVVVQFRREFLGAEVLQLPEFARIRRLLDRASRGLIFSKRYAGEGLERLQSLAGASGLRAVLMLLETLDFLASDSRARPLASLANLPVPDRRKEARLARVFGFAAQRFREEVTLADLAEAAAMSPAGFSRYFKNTTGRSPSDFLNDLRITHACQLLRETSRTVLDIAVDSGFPTLTNFNRRFRERTSMSPREYRQVFAG